MQVVKRIDVNSIEMPGIFSSPFVSSKVTATTTKEQKYTQPKKESIKTQLCVTSRFNARNLLLNWNIIAY